MSQSGNPAHRGDEADDRDRHEADVLRFIEEAQVTAQGVEAAVKKYPLPTLLTVFQKACSRYPLRGTPVTLLSPTEPVADSDWEAAG